MVERRPPRTPATLALYERGLSAVAPFARAIVGQRARSGRDMAGRLAERRGLPSAPRPDGPLVWVHASDEPDLAALMPLIERVTALGLWALVTTRTVEAGLAATTRLPDGAIHQLAPLDVPAFADRFMAHWRPSLALIGAGELMPTLVLRARRGGAATVLVDGRLTERSYGRWRRARRTIAAILGRFDLCLARTDGDAARLAGLGARRIVSAGDMRFDAVPAPHDPRRLKALRARLGRRPVMVAAGACPGEEISVARAHAIAREQAPDLLTIVAPERSDAADQAADAARGEGLPVVRLSEDLAGDVEIAVAEEGDELGLLYRVADVTFLGGSLVRRGGRDPVEPAKLGAPILHGPHVETFEEIYAALHAADAAAAVDGSDALGAETLRLVADPAERAAMARSARAACSRLGGALDRTLAAIEPYLFQLRLGGESYAQPR